MELVPRVPSERAVRAVLAASFVAIFAVLVGAGFGVFGPLGAPAGGLGAWLVVRRIRKTDAASRAESALDRFECVAVACAEGIFVASLAAFVARGAWVHVLAAVGVVYAVALLALALVRDRARRSFLESVYAAEHPSVRVARDVDVRGFERLPSAVSGVLTDAVLAHTGPMSATYRSSGGLRPLARVAASLPLVTARLERRARVAAVLACGLAGAASLACLAPARTHAAARPTARADVLAPLCSDAVPYFEERLESLSGVTRATLLTHASDPAVAEGHGVVLVEATAAEPSARRRTLARALDVARAIPCRDRLELGAAAAEARPFDVSAELVLEPGADPASVLHDAGARVRALFEPAAEAVEVEPVRLGVEEKTFGYRVRAALARVAGVRAVRLTVDGRDADAALGPRDYPVLRSLSLSVAK